MAEKVSLDKCCRVNRTVVNWYPPAKGYPLSNFTSKGLELGNLLPNIASGRLNNFNTTFSSVESLFYNGDTIGGYEVDLTPESFLSWDALKQLDINLFEVFLCRDSSNVRYIFICVRNFSIGRINFPSVIARVESESNIINQYWDSCPSTVIYKAKDSGAASFEKTTSASLGYPGFNGSKEPGYTDWDDGWVKNNTYWESCVQYNSYKVETSYPEYYFKGATFKYGDKTYSGDEKILISRAYLDPNSVGLQYLYFEWNGKSYRVPDFGLGTQVIRRLDSLFRRDYYTYTKLIEWKIAIPEWDSCGSTGYDSEDDHFVQRLAKCKIDPFYVAEHSKDCKDYRGYIDNYCAASEDWDICPGDLATDDIPLPNIKDAWTNSGTFFGSGRSDFSGLDWDTCSFYDWDSCGDYIDYDREVSLFPNWPSATRNVLNAFNLIASDAFKYPFYYVTALSGDEFYDTYKKKFTESYIDKSSALAELLYENYKPDSDFCEVPYSFIESGISLFQKLLDVLDKVEEYDYENEGYVTFKELLSSEQVTRLEDNIETLQSYYNKLYFHQEFFNNYFRPQLTFYKNRDKFLAIDNLENLYQTLKSQKDTFAQSYLQDVPSTHFVRYCNKEMEPSAPLIVFYKDTLNFFEGKFNHTLFSNFYDEPKWDTYLKVLKKSGILETFKSLFSLVTPNFDSEELETFISNWAQRSLWDYASLVRKPDNFREDSSHLFRSKLKNLYEVLIGWSLTPQVKDNLIRVLQVYYSLIQDIIILDHLTQYSWDTLGDYYKITDNVSLDALDYYGSDYNYFKETFLQNDSELLSAYNLPVVINIQDLKDTYNHYYSYQKPIQKWYEVLATNSTSNFNLLFDYLFGKYPEYKIELPENPTLQSVYLENLFKDYLLKAATYIVDGTGYERASPTEDTKWYKAFKAIRCFLKLEGLVVDQKVQELFTFEFTPTKVTTTLKPQDSFRFSFVSNFTSIKSFIIEILKWLIDKLYIETNFNYNLQEKELKYSFIDFFGELQGDSFFKSYLSNDPDFEEVASRLNSYKYALGFDEEYIKESLSMVLDSFATRLNSVEVPFDKDFYMSLIESTDKLYKDVSNRLAELKEGVKDQPEKVNIVNQVEAVTLETTELLIKQAFKKPFEAYKSYIQNNPNDPELLEKSLTFLARDSNLKELSRIYYKYPIQIETNLLVKLIESYLRSMSPDQKLSYWKNHKDILSIIKSKEV